MSPPNLIRAILQAPVDLLFNGGIGTYIKAESESDADVGDRANDPVRVNGNQVRAKVIGEGGNLGVTARGRVEFDLSGGRINTDAMDNSAGVDCSDHEVNIKILIDSLVTAGKVKAEERKQLLESMTDEVAQLVLADNEDQNDLIGTSRANAASLFPVHADQIRHLAERGLNRELEALPSEKEIQRRTEAGIGLTSPELSTLMAHVKLGLKEEHAGHRTARIRMCSRPGLPQYFPTPLRERFTPEIRIAPAAPRDRHDHADQRSGGHRRHQLCVPDQPKTSVSGRSTRCAPTSPPTPSSAWVTSGGGSARRTCRSRCRTG